jgi:predicted Fe-Mo cluster-binding NifX family protein
MKYRVAIASFDGTYVDQHFGHARKYYIYDFDSETNTYEFIEKRFVETKCACASHDENAFANVFETLSDVSAIIISRIGLGASDIVENKGYVIYESTYPVEDVLKGIANGRLYEVDKWQKITKN